jgi:multidrug efflux pump subunit AcrA (membrane-fusion protein)
MRKWWLVGIVVGVMALLIVYSAWPKPVPVDVAPARISPLIGQLSATGEVDGLLAEVGTKASGEVEQVYVVEGEAVAEGTPLARISPTPTGMPSSTADLLSLQVVKSPFAGVVARRHVDPGDAVVPGLALFAVVDPDRLWVTAYVDDVDLPKVREGMPVEVSLPAYLSPGYAAKVVSVGSLAAPRSELESGARTVRVRIELVEPMPGLLPGVEVNVDAQVALRARALLVPADAVVEENANRYVWVIEAGRVQRQQITTGINNYLAVEVLDGLAEGCQVVVSNKDELDPGQAVRPHEISVPLNVE